MLRGRAVEGGFSAFLETPEGKAAPAWRIEILAAWPWPDGARPSVETYARINAALDTVGASLSASDRAGP